MNSYGLEKANLLLPKLREQGLVEPKYVANLKIEEMIVKLFKSGYNRGMLAEIMAERVICLMKAVHAGDLDDLPSLVKKGQKAETRELLLTVKGIGPKVAGDAWKLLNS